MIRYIDHLPFACPTRGKEFKLFQETIEFFGREKKNDQIYRREDNSNFPKRTIIHSVLQPEDSKFVSLPFFIHLRENLLLLLDILLKKGGGVKGCAWGSTWCSNQWERDLEQNSVPFLASGYVAFAIDFVLKARREYFWKTSISGNMIGQKCAKARLAPPFLFTFCGQLLLE